MSIRYLDTLSEPVSIAVIGASPYEGRLGQRIWRALQRGCRCADGVHQPFSGALWPVNPHHDFLDGVKVFHRLRQLPQPPELAVVAIPAAAVADVVAELAHMGTKTVLVLSPDMTAQQRQAMLNAGKRQRVRILGPNRAGLIVPRLGLNASLAPMGALSGDLALLSQSSALATAMIDWASARGIGFSQVVMLGERADIDLADWLDHLGSDVRTRAILVYMEQPESARKFLSASRAASRNKPVVVVKPGQRPMAGPLLGLPMWGNGFATEAVFDTAVARAGMLRVPTLPDLLLAAEILARCRDTRARGLSVLSSSEGLVALACQAAIHAGVEVHALVLPDDASNASIAAALRTALDADPDKVVLWVHAPSIDEASTTALAEYLLPIAATQPLRVLGCWLGEATVQKARALWRQAGIPDFATPEAAIRAWNLLHTHRQHQQQLLQTPPRHPSQCCDVQRLRAYLHRQDWAACATSITLEDTHAQEVLAAAGWSIHADLSTSHPARLVMQVRDDPAFGPVLALGLGDAGQERYALALPPLNIALAKTALSPLNLEQDVIEKCALAWVSLSQLLLEMPTCRDAVIEGAVDAQGWTVLHARMHLQPNLCASELSCMTRFAIQPYPDALIQVQDWRGQALTIRPIRPEDEAQHLAFLRQLSPEDIRMRIFHSRRTIDHSELARLTQIDYAREMALIATVVENGIEATLGTVRAMIDPDNDTAEFGVIVRSDLKNGGIGRRLMLALIAHLRERGTRRVVGTVLRANLAMRQFAQSLGFTEHSYADHADNDTHDEHICLVELLL